MKISKEAMESWRNPKAAFGALAGLVLAGIGLAFKDSIAKAAKPFIEDSIRWFTLNLWVWLKIIGRFLVNPVALPSGFYFLVVVGLALLAAFVLCGNLWIALGGPRQSQYVTDEFYGLRWAWRWGKRPGLSPNHREVMEIAAFCLKPGCSAPSICLQPRNELIGKTRQYTYYHCAGCKNHHEIQGVFSVNECSDIKLFVRQHILDDLENGTWKKNIKANRISSSRLTLSIALLVERMFAR